MLKAKHTKHIDWKTKKSKPKHSSKASLSKKLFGIGRASSSLPHNPLQGVAPQPNSRVPLWTLES